MRLTLKPSIIQAYPFFLMRQYLDALTANIENAAVSV